MRVAIIGGSGKMGRWFAGFLSRDGKEVVINGDHRAEMGYLIMDAVQALALAVVDEVERCGAADVRRRIEELE